MKELGLWILSIKSYFARLGNILYCFSCQIEADLKNDLHQKFEENINLNRNLEAALEKESALMTGEFYVSTFYWYRHSSISVATDSSRNKAYTED